MPHESEFHRKSQHGTEVNWMVQDGSWLRTTSVPIKATKGRSTNISSVEEAMAASIKGGPITHACHLSFECVQPDSRSSFRPVVGIIPILCALPLGLPPTTPEGG